MASVLSDRSALRERGAWRFARDCPAAVLVLIRAADRDSGALSHRGGIGGMHRAGAPVLVGPARRPGAGAVPGRRGLGCGRAPPAAFRASTDWATLFAQSFSRLQSPPA